MKGVRYEKIYVLVLITLLITIILMVALNKDSTIHIATLGNYTSKTSSGSFDTYRIIEYIVDKLNSEGKDYVIVQYELEDYKNYDDMKASFKENKIDLVIGPNSTSEAEPLLLFLQSLDMPVFLTNVASDKYTGLDDNIFRINTTVSEQAEKLLMLFWIGIMNKL